MKLSKEEKQLEKEWQIFNTLRSICRLPMWSMESYRWYLQTLKNKE